MPTAGPAVVVSAPGTGVGRARPGSGGGAEGKFPCQGQRGGGRSDFLVCLQAWMANALITILSDRRAERDHPHTSRSVLEMVAGSVLPDGLVHGLLLVRQ